jgi:hypothetical protein
LSTHVYLPQKMGYLRKQWPGMNPREIVVFNNWLLIHFNDYSGFDFNVRVGQGTDPGPTFSEDMRRQFIQNTQKRIDVLAWKDSNPTIIEVKDRAGLSSIGQIIGYSHLWKADNPAALVPLLLLVFNRTDNDVILTAQAAGILIETVEADFSGLKASSHA